MTIIHPKKTRQSKTSPVMVMGLLLVVALTALNAIVYTKTVTVEHGVRMERKSLESAQSENAALKNSWYEAVDEKNIQTLVMEYGFVKITSPHYLPS